MIDVGFYNTYLDGRSEYVANLPFVLLPPERIPNPFKLSENLKDSHSLKCPTITNFYSNVYEIKSSYTFTLKYEEGVIKPYNTNLKEEFNKNFIGNVINNVEYLNKKQIIFQIITNNFYQSDSEDVFIEVLNPLYHNSNCSILNARLNIYDYPRQVHIPILWKDISLPLTINWGEVICLVRFTQYNNPYVKINLKEILNPNEVVPNYVKNFNIFSRFKINFFKLLPQLRKLRKKKMMKL